MDELFDAINVRDLLSTGDLTDPSSPLSAPDLRLLISRLESYSLQIKSKVQLYLHSHYNDFSSLFSLCNAAVLQTDQVSRTISDLLRLVSDTPVDVEMREIVEEVNRKMKEARVKKELLELVKVIVGIEKRLREARDAARSGRLRFAAQELQELKIALRIGEEEDGEPVVYGLLRKEWLNCFEEIQELLVKFTEAAVHFDRDSSTVRVVYQLSFGGISGVNLCMILEAMEVAGILNYGLAKVADQMIKFVFAPVIVHCSHISFSEDVKEFSGEFSEAILKSVPFSDSKVEDGNCESIYSAIIRVIKFVHKYICFENGSWIHSFGRLTWPRISELIISKFLSKAVPDDASKLPEFQKIIEHTSQFESTLRDLNFVSHSDNIDRKLTNFVENVEVHFASRKKMEILANARQLLLQCDFTLPQDYKKDLPVNNGGLDVNSSEQVVDLLFLSERCVVSKAASQLVKLVHQTLKETCLSSPRVAVELYHVARDALLLYEAVIPVKLERQLDGINQVSVLMHNDFLYLSQEILGLAFQYRPDFPNSLKEHAVFVDMAPRFHVMAEKTLQRQVKLIIHNLKEAIDGANGFQNTHQIQQFESAKFSIDQVVFIVEKVHIIWEPILLPLTYKKSMCTVLESVFSEIARDILILDDLAAEETLQLQRLIHLMLDSLSSTMDSVAAVIRKEKLEEYSRCSLDEHIPSLQKLHKLTELLDMPLKSITASWESGELLTCGFTMSEVKDFIKAIFADSPLRKECLWRIENVSL